MAASSAKDKAHALKDSYVAGLIEGGATAPAPTMPTQDMGEQASVVIRPGRTETHNDGDPGIYTSPASSGIYEMRQVGSDPRAAESNWASQQGVANRKSLGSKIFLDSRGNDSKTPGTLMRKQRLFDQVYPNHFERIHVY